MPTVAGLQSYVDKFYRFIPAQVDDREQLVRTGAVVRFKKTGDTQDMDWTDKEPSVLHCSNVNIG